MTKVGFDVELLLAPHDDCVSPREDEVEFSPEEAAPLQQERQESNSLAQLT